MNKYILFLLFLAFTTIGFAQESTSSSFSRQSYNQDPVKRKWKQTVEQKDSVWILSLYDKQKQLKEKVTFGDQKLEIPKGLFTAYFEDGSIKEQGNYERGFKAGEWTTNYPNHRLMEKANYSLGSLHGAYKAYWDNGTVKKEGVYSLRKKSGSWRMYYRDGKPALIENYDDNGKLIEGAYYDQNGGQKDKLAITQVPSYTGGMTAFYRHLMQTIKYPVEAAKNKISGSVRLEFMVTKEGRIEEINVISSPDGDLTAEAIRVLKLSSGWIPGQELGEPVNMKYIMPIKFGIR